LSDEGFVTRDGYRTYYLVEGDLDSSRTPLVLLHGGPGLPHGYFEPLAALADERAIVFYDQLGCGRSDQPEDDTLWTFDTFVSELDAVVAHLELARFSVLGHSWGGWLALEWLLRKPRPALAALVLASTCASLPAFGRMTRALKATLPQETQDALDRHEAAGTTDDPEYGAASFAYIREFMVRADPIPEFLLTAAAAKNARIADLMQGPEWNVNGRIAGWDVTARLGEIDVPTLVTSGRFDEMTPWVVEPLASGIRGAEWAVFEKSAHVAHVEEPDRYVAVVRDFLSRVDARRPALETV